MRRLPPLTCCCVLACSNALLLCCMLQNLCLFRMVEVFHGSTLNELMSSIVAIGSQPPKLVIPRKIQDNKKVLYRVRRAATAAAATSGISQGDRGHA